MCVREREQKQGLTVRARLGASNTVPNRGLPRAAPQEVRRWYAARTKTTRGCLRFHLSVPARGGIETTGCRLVPGDISTTLGGRSGRTPTDDAGQSEGRIRSLRSGARQTVVLVVSPQAADCLDFPHYHLLSSLGAGDALVLRSWGPPQFVHHFCSLNWIM